MRAAAPYIPTSSRALCLSLYGILDWRSVPEMPVEIVLLPRWFPFHLSKVSYWARTVLVPLLVLQALRPRAKNPLGVTHRRAFCRAAGIDRAGAEGAASDAGAGSLLFRGIDVILRPAVKLFPKSLRQRAIDRGGRFCHRAAQWRGRSRRDLSGDGECGDDVRRARRQGQRRDRARLDRQAAGRSRATRPIASRACRRCGTRRSPVMRCSRWAATTRGASALRGLDWLVPHQVLDVVGDWATRRPHVRPGGWAFQYANPHYPDLDDTAVVVMAMDRARRVGCRRPLRSGRSRAPSNG